MKPRTSTPDELGAAHGSGEVVHGFTLEPGQDASSLRWWPEFVEYFERVEGITPHPRDTQHKRLFEYFVQGAFCQWESQNAPDVATKPAPVGSEKHE